MSGLHKGHRQRVKDKYMSFGLDIFEEHEILELLLFYAVPQKDTNPLAHKLLNEFGSLPELFDAPLSRLLSFGLTENVACFIKLMPDIARVYEENKWVDRDKMFDLRDACDFFKLKFIGRQEEVLYLLLLDPKMKNIFCGIVSRGDLSSTDVPIRQIIELSLRYKAKFAVVAHNHPSGFAIPSSNDLSTTKSLAISLDKIGVKLLDHIIVSDSEQLSLYYSTYNSKNDLFISRL